MWLAASPAASEPKGRFFFDRRAVSPHRTSRTEKNEDEARDALLERLFSLIDADPSTALR